MQNLMTEPEGTSEVSDLSKGHSSTWRTYFNILWSNRKSRVGLIVFSTFILISIFGQLIAPYSASNTSFPTMMGPSLQHLLGTTQEGQDVLSQLLVGTGISVITALATGLIATLIAVFIGFLSGYSQGAGDDGLSFLTNVFLVLPALPLLIVLASYAPGRGSTLIIIIVGLTGWPWGARVLRAQVKSLRTRDYVLAAKLAGDSTMRILMREILPNMLSLVMAGFLGASQYGLLTSVGLEFLGLGNPNQASWGTMLYWAQNASALLSGQWAWILAPGLCIALFGMSMVLINFGFDRIANPRLGGAEE
ncbi:MAG: peptide ABC transporter permease [Sulfobacillus benefaciens]|uniref:Peptide ABC transporter permease n=1 Tax=Sulfobacillus benefaciens TaxID=453960 RepID=A0A2T2X536_9FIRM|nr:MAG: peptide ABC transporter permease [Sulfobacillus benefaciens]